jgi:hypothetical protein
MMPAKCKHCGARMNGKTCLQLALLCLLLISLGCAPKPRPKDYNPYPDRKPRVVWADDCKWVVYDGYQAVDIEHSPRCPCYGDSPPVDISVDGRL